jgi:hypothetical protein
MFSEQTRDSYAFLNATYLLMHAINCEQHFLNISYFVAHYPTSGLTVTRLARVYYSRIMISRGNSKKVGGKPTRASLISRQISHESTRERMFGWKIWTVWVTTRPSAWCNVLLCFFPPPHRLVYCLSQRSLSAYGGGGHSVSTATSIDPYYAEMCMYFIQHSVWRLHCKKSTYTGKTPGVCSLCRGTGRRACRGANSWS